VEELEEELDEELLAEPDELLLTPIRATTPAIRNTHSSIIMVTLSPLSCCLAAEIPGSAHSDSTPQPLSIPEIKM